MRYCVSCARKAHECPIIQLDTLSPDVGICFDCHDKLKRRGVSFVGTSAEADRQLATSREYRDFLAREAAGRPKCLHCGERTLVLHDGSQPAWCSDCETSRKRLMGGMK